MSDDLRTQDPEIVDQMDSGADDSHALAVQTPSLPVVGGQQAEFVGNISYPYLQITHGVGKLAEAGFIPGELVLKDTVLYSPPNPRKPADPVDKPLNIIILNFKQYYKEYVAGSDYDDGKMPKVFATAAEAQAAGFTTDWVNGVAATAPAAMRWLILIEQPEKAGVAPDYFCIPALGKLWAPAYMNLEKSSYRAVKDTFGLSVRVTKTSGRGIHSIMWNLATRQQKAKTTGNTTWVPDFKKKVDLTAEQVAEVLKGM